MLLVPPLARRHFGRSRINYLAKDYASFRQLILDRLALIMPEWQETHVPDLGITLVELLAYVGDYLSYYQDAVATEAYLDTARQRISVRRHVRLVDYAMHEGCNARTWVAVARIPTLIRSDADLLHNVVPRRSGQKHILTPADLVNVPASSYDVFEPLLPGERDLADLPGAQRNLVLYLGRLPVLPRERRNVGDAHRSVDLGTRVLLRPRNGRYRAQHRSAQVRRATVRRNRRALNLKPGDVFIFEEVIGPKTGNLRMPIRHIARRCCSPASHPRWTLFTIRTRRSPASPSSRSNGRRRTRSPSPLHFRAGPAARLRLPGERERCARQRILVDNGGTTGEPLASYPRARQRSAVPPSASRPRSPSTRACFVRP